MLNLLLKTTIEMKVNQFTDPIKDLAESGKLAGLLLILATVLSISFANSGRAESYLGIWHMEIGFCLLYTSDAADE